MPEAERIIPAVDAAKDVRDPYASIRCTYCKRQRYYAVADLLTAFGDMECDDVIRVTGLRCRKCHGKDSLDFRLGGPPSDMADVAIQRKIDRVFYIRKIVWKDKRGV